MNQWQSNNNNNKTNHQKQVTSSDLFLGQGQFVFHIILLMYDFYIINKN